MEEAVFESDSNETQGITLIKSKTNTQIFLNYLAFINLLLNW